MSSRQRFVIGAAVSVLTAITLAVLGPTFTSDSASYVRGLVFRSPVVPDVLWILRSVLGSALSLRAFVAVQALVGCASAAFAARELVRALAVAPAATTWIAAALFLPQIQSARSVTSESLAYSFVLFAMGFACAYLTTDARRRNLACMIASVGLAIETRAQFAILLPFALLLVAYDFVRAGSARSRALTAGALGAVLVSIFALQASYTLPRTGGVRGVPFTGCQLFTTVVYFANDDVIESVRPGLGREFAVAVREGMKHYGIAHDSPTELPHSRHFEVSYNPILSVGIHEYAKLALGRPDAPGRFESLSPEEWHRYDRFTVGLSLEMLRRVWPAYVASIARRISEADKYLAVLASIFALVALVDVARRRTEASRPRLVLGVLGVVWLANTLLVASLEVVALRYTFYFDVPILAAVLGIVVAATERAQARDQLGAVSLDDDSERAPKASSTSATTSASK